MKQRVGAAVKAVKEAARKKGQLKLVSSKRAEQKKEAEIAELILTHRENGRKLARSILRRWRVRMPTDEIDSIVDLALCEAARRFSSEHGAAFMTFFFYHLRGHLVRAVARAAQASNVFMSYGQSSGIDTGDWQRLASDPSWNLVSESFVSLQGDICTPENEILRKEKIKQCHDAVMQLDALERQIISRSFASEQALVDIARSLGYSRCHISRVKKAALLRLKRIILGRAAEATEEDFESEIEEVSAERNVDVREGARRRSRRRTVGARARAVSKELRTKAA